MQSEVMLLHVCRNSCRYCCCVGWQAGVSLEETLGHTGNMAIAIDGCTHEEYFYIELPLSESTSKRRFVYVKPSGGSGGDRQDRFPMHFGMEVR
jgi:hypothetical protein